MTNQNAAAKAVADPGLSVMILGAKRQANGAFAHRSPTKLNLLTRQRELPAMASANCRSSQTCRRSILQEGVGT